MTKVALKDATRQLDSLVDEAIGAGRPVTIQRADGQAAVLIAAADYRGLVETAHLLSSPANAARLLTALKAAEAGELQAHDPAA